MITRREFEDTVNQVNKIFHVMEDKIKKMEVELEALKSVPKATPRKKTT